MNSKTIFIMYSKTIQTIATIALVAFVGIQAQAQKQSAVSIIFTDLNNLSTVDTLIPAGEAALESLLSSHSLQTDQVHMIHMNSNAMNWVEKEGEQHRVMVIESKESTSAEASVDEEKHEVRVIKIEGGDMEGLSEEERALVEKHVEEARKHKADGKEEMIIEKRVVIKKDGDEHAEHGEEHKEIQIEVTVEDGEQTVVAHVNGERLSDEEAKELLKEQHTVDVDIDMETERQMVFIAEDEEIKDGEVRIERRAYAHNDISDMKAIVIVKELDKAPAGTTTPENKGALSLYPNPAKENVMANIEGVNGDYTLTLSNLAGQTVWVEKGNASGKVNKEIGLGDFPAGTYILSVSHDAGLNSQKLVVE